MKLISRFQGSKVPNFFLGTLQSDTGLICPNPTLLPFHGTQSEFFLCPVNRSFRQALAVSNAVEIAGIEGLFLFEPFAEECRFVALVGASGSGKTTVARLLARFWDITGGEISIGGVPITHMTQEHLLSKISMVFQDVYLFRDTIAANIRIGRPDASDAEIIAAAKAAACHDFITALPDGYDTMIMLNSVPNTAAD